MTDPLIQCAEKLDAANERVDVLEAALKGIILAAHYRSVDSKYLLEGRLRLVESNARSALKSEGEG